MGGQHDSLVRDNNSYRGVNMENIDKLAGALSKAQGVMAGAKKDAENPFFKKNYSDLAAVWNAIREPLSSNGLSVVQSLGTVKGQPCVITYLLHNSGQSMKSVLAVKPPKPDMQSLGAAISYARRYALSAMVGVYQVDLDADDDQGDNGNGAKKTQPKKHTPPAHQDDVPLGNVPPITHDKFITPKEATEVRKKCSELKIPPKVAKSMIKDLGISTVDEIPADRKQEILDALEFLHSEMAGTTHD